MSKSICGESFTRLLHSLGYEINKATFHYDDIASIVDDNKIYFKEDMCGEDIYKYIAIAVIKDILSKMMTTRQ